MSGGLSHNHPDRPRRWAYKVGTIGAISVVVTFVLLKLPTLNVDEIITFALVSPILVMVAYAAGYLAGGVADVIAPPIPHQAGRISRADATTHEAGRSITLGREDAPKMRLSAQETEGSVLETQKRNAREYIYAYLLAVSVTLIGGYLVAYWSWEVTTTLNDYYAILAILSSFLNYFGFSAAYSQFHNVSIKRSAIWLLALSFIGVILGIGRANQAYLAINDHIPGWLVAWIFVTHMSSMLLFILVGVGRQDGRGVSQPSQETKDARSAYGNERQLGQSRASTLAGARRLTPDREVLPNPAGVAQEKSLLPMYLNDTQFRIIKYATFSLAGVLAFIFLKVGWTSEYSNSLRVFVWGARWNDEYGLLARTGVPGVILGLVVPIVLCVAIFVVEAGRRAK